MPVRPFRAFRNIVARVLGSHIASRTCCGLWTLRRMQPPEARRLLQKHTPTCAPGCTGTILRNCRFCFWETEEFGSEVGKAPDTFRIIFFVVRLFNAWSKP